MADFVGAKPGGVIFTGGGTDRVTSPSWARRSRIEATHDKSVIVTSRVEHDAVLDAAQFMADHFEDVEVRFIDVDADGVVDLESLRHHSIVTSPS